MNIDMEWTQEKIEKLQAQFNKKHADFMSKCWESDSLARRPTDVKELWRELLESFGIHVRPRAVEMQNHYCLGSLGIESRWEEAYLQNDGNMCLVHPLYAHEMLVVSQETAERILVLGMI